MINRSATLLVGIAMLSSLVLGEDLAPQNAGPEWVMIQEGVYELSDAEGGHHLRLFGLEGLWWNIRRYERLLGSLQDPEGNVPEAQTQKAEFYSKRLQALYEIADARGESPVGGGDDQNRYGCLSYPQGKCLVDYAQKSCGVNTYEVSSYACALMDISSGYHGPYAYAKVRNWGCSAYYQADGHVLVYTDGDGYKEDWSTGNEFNLQVDWIDTEEHDCAYALAEVTVDCPNCDAWPVYFVCEDQDPADCY